MKVEQSNSKSQGASQNETLSKRKRRKKKKSQKNRKKNQNNSLKSKSQSKSQQQTVHLPHAKITIRNIENTEKLGSLESVVELLRDLIRDRNEAVQKLDGPMMSEESALIAKIVSPVDIVLDESSISRILEREKERAYKELKERLKKKEEEQTASQQTGEEPSEAEIGTGTETEYEAQSQAQAENDAKDNAEFDDCLKTDVVNDEGPKLKSTVDIGSVQHDNKSEETKDKNSADANNISARVLVSSRYLKCIIIVLLQYSTYGAALMGLASLKHFKVYGPSKEIEKAWRIAWTLLSSSVSTYALVYTGKNESYCSGRRGD